MSKINGIYAASVSILDENLKLDINKTIRHAENLIKSGCHGVVIFGSTGQSQLISLEEKFELIQNISESLFKDKFIIGTGLNSLQDTISLIKISNSYNFNYFLIMPPAYYMYEDEGEGKAYASLPGQADAAPPANVSPEMAEAMKQFPQWSQAEIQGYFDQGWDVNSLQDWLDNQ